MAASSSSVQSIDRVLDILESLSSTPQGLLLSEVAAATNLHVSTAHRLLHALVARGYAVKDPDSNRYRLTLRTFEIGCRVSSVWNILTTARPYLDQLANLSRETVHLVERDGNSIVYLYKAEPYQQTVGMASHVGLRNPMYCTGVGKCILANLPPDQVQKIWNSENIVQYTDKTIISFDRMTEELATIKKRGYAYDDEEHEVGVHCIAVPIYNWKEEPVSAISISAPVFRTPPSKMEEFLPSMKQAAAEISQLFGFIPR